jgi:ketosteroid isomerase-like protein
VTVIDAEIRCALDDLVATYALSVDDREFDTLAALFTEDAELALPDPPRRLDAVHTHRGRDAVLRAVTAVAAVPRTLHLLGGQVYRPGPAPDLVLGRIAGSAHHLTPGPDGTTDLVWQLRYTDTYRRAGGGWLIARRAVDIQWIETRPVRKVLPW